ncbi:CDK5 regulatory subunit-associated protein 3 isoform X4 [Corvus hawaiiensis]|uniref:CDK5 regulatory subunit-associated protein 3 isoform X2 n=1 Tax=Corvus hawaiiensis TaxID=134902 RepID=UPI002018C675|nr:CDK5 regulatory subunit-associated protein 3 isoform X2 [Corvus hawaiiensis]XP_048174543.1 CDK5 regulatory subunit-associated protein 3 isoform X3 [Corvus hawaiiensis]XP_048174552.1 CDK5 regulatory subunit-associated protein 3 isoform X4 [Corvus hawaiiensis]
MQVAPQEYQNVPIDIQTSKLLDWLVDRRHCSRRWQAQLQLVRERLQVAIQDMPENPEIKELLEGSYLHYFHCLRIVEILKGTEASTKNLFGRYSSQRMKDWQEVVSLYEKENTYLAELSSLLGRSIGYEVPALRRQLGRCQQAQQELARREDECQLGASELRERFLASCRQYGIAGADVRQELLALVQELPSLLSRIGAGASALGEAIELYQACVAFVCDSPGAEVVPLLRFVGRSGNTTVFQWRTGLPPRRVERPELRRTPQEPPQQDTIDWGDFPAEAPQGGDIDWGITVESSPQGDDGIDWGDGEKGTITVEPSPQGDDGIDWGDGEGQEGTITVVEAGTEAPEGVARGSDALTLLENPETRNQFIDELMELELFLAQRLLELEDEADVVAMSQLQLAPAVLQGQSGDRVRAQLATARELLAQLCSRSVQHLCMILASPRYVERVTALLRQKLHQAELLLAKRDALAQKRREALAEQAALEPKLQRLQEKTRELQKLIEADISRRYGGRPVNLMGINL